MRIYTYIIIILVMCSNASAQSYQSKTLSNSSVEGTFYKADLGELYPFERYEISITCENLILPWGYKIYKINPSAPSDTGLDLVNEQWLALNWGTPVEINSITSDSIWGPGHYYLLLASCMDIGLSATTGIVAVDIEKCVGPSTKWNLAITKLTDMAAEQYWIEQGKRLGQQNQQREAIGCYDYALWINPGSAEALVNKGIALFQLGVFSDAIDCFNAALVINPRSSEALKNKGVALGKLNRHMDALDALHRAIEIQPDYGVAWLELGVEYYSINDCKNATIAFTKSLSLNRDFKNSHKKVISDAWYCWGKALSDEDMYCEATEAFATAFNINKFNIAAREKNVAAEVRCHALQPLANASRNLNNSNNEVH